MHYASIKLLFQVAFGLWTEPLTKPFLMYSVIDPKSPILPPRLALDS